MKACKVLERLGVTRRTLNSYIKSGKIHVEKLPNGFYEYNDNDVLCLERNVVKRNRIVITQENGIVHTFSITYNQAEELAKLVTEFLKR